MVTVEVDEEIWRYLTTKKNPGDSHNDVLRRELGFDDDCTVDEQGEREPWRTVLDDWTPSEANTDRAREVAAQVVAWLASQDEPQQKGDVLAWAEGRDLGFSDSTLWLKVVRPALGELADAELATHTRNVGWEIVD